MTVYFLSFDGRQTIKIGYCKDFEQRLKTYNTHTPYAVETIFLTAGGRKLEQAFHALFKRDRVPGTREWYCFSERMKNFLHRQSAGQSLEAGLKQLRRVNFHENILGVSAKTTSNVIR